jgi:hypothetical protein
MRYCVLTERVLIAEQEESEHRALMTRQGERLRIACFINAYDSRLKVWMARFKGVATRIWPDYPGWRRLLEKHDVGLAPLLNA